MTGINRELPPLGASLRRHLGAIALSTAVAIGIAVVYVATASFSYSSSAVVLLSPAPGNPLTAAAASGSGVQTTVAMSTETELVRTPAVGEIVSEKLGRSAPGSRERLVVTIPANTQMLAISFTSTTPERAREGAQGYADGYLAFRGERAKSTQDGTIATLDEKITATQTDLRRAVAEAAAAGGASFASQEVQLLTDRLAQLNNSLSSAQSVSVTPGAVISPATVPGGSNGLPRWAYLAAAALLGLLVGCGYAMLREWRRDLVRSTESDDEMGVPVFATIREFEGRLAAGERSSSSHEDYRRLRAAVIANAPTPHVLGVAAVDPSGSFGVATNLAVVLAEAHFSVLLVVADPEESEIEDVLGIGQRPGLVEAVRGDSPLSDLLVDVQGVSLLTSGIDAAKSRDLLASPAFSYMINDAREAFDYVVLLAAPAGSPDGDSVLLAADSALLVLASDLTTKARLGAVLERFDRLSIATMGAVKLTQERTRRASRGSSAVAAGTPTSR